MFRRYSAVLLLLVMAPLLIAMPVGNGQSFTTVTNVNTVTTQATFTQASQYAIATTTVTSAASESIYDSQFTLKGVGVRYCMIAPGISFDATQGQQVQGTFQSSIANSLVLYLMTDLQLKTWENSPSHYCDPGESGVTPVLTAFKVTSYTLDWTVPADGTYWVVIETWSAGDCVVTASIAKHYSQVVVSTLYSTQTSLLLLTATQTVTSISTQEVPAPASIQGNSTLTFAGLGVIIVVALAAVYFVLSKRKQKKV